MTGSWAWNFVRSRQGEPTDRTARLRAYSTVRRWLALDRSLAPELRVELQERLEILGINPLEQSVFDEAEIARKQWAALLRYADDPEGLPRQLQSDRNAEMTRYTHGGWARAGLTAARVATLGIYRHQEPLEQQELAVALDRQRRAERQVRFLETVARSNAQPEAVWDMDRVHEALTAVDELAAAGFPQRSAKVVEQILAHTNDAATRALCEQALESLRAAAE